MTKEINLQIPDSLFQSLTEQAKLQRVSLEALCSHILSEKGPEPSESTLVEPGLYSCMPNGELRREVQKVLKSDLPEKEVRRRVQILKTQIARCIR